MPGRLLLESTRGRLLLALGMAGAVGLFLATVPLHRDWFDLSVYYGTVHYWAHGGHIYDYRVPGTHYGFTYPPFAAVCMLPMALIGWQSAVAIGLLLNVAVAAAVLYGPAVQLARQQGWSRWFTFAVAGCLFALLEPVRDTFSFGQVNLLLLALVLADAWLLSSSSGPGAASGRMPSGVKSAAHVTSGHVGSGQVASGQVGSRQAGSERVSSGQAGSERVVLGQVVSGQVDSRQAGSERVSSGQVSPGRSRFAGVGIGLAAAIKLTPAIFIGYLLVTRRWRAAAVAASVAAGATLIGVWAAPDASKVYWTQAMWDTDRVGSLAYVSNQSWQGVLARLAEPADPSRAMWALGVVAVLCVWAYRATRAVAAGDEPAGIALTGAAACLISPVTWVHHLVWLIPSLAVLADEGFRRAGAGREKPRRLLVCTAVVYAVLCSSVVWLWRFDFSGIDGFLGSNTYVWISLGLLLALPVRRRPAQRTGHDCGAPRRTRKGEEAIPPPA